MIISHSSPIPTVADLPVEHRTVSDLQRIERADDPCLGDYIALTDMGQYR